MAGMKRYGQGSLTVTDLSSRPLWKQAAAIDLLYVGYGFFIVSLVVVSYVLGALNFLPHDPQEMNLSLLMAPPGVAGHLLGTDFMGRDILSRLIVGIQAYFVPGLCRNDKMLIF